MRKILKEALTVCIFIDEIENSIEYNKYHIPEAKIRFCKKIIRNFLRRLKQSEFYKLKDSYGETYYKRIQDHLESKRRTDNTAVYLTYIQMQIHSFVRHFLPETMGHGGYRRNPEHVSYYKPTLEILSQ